jgi:hypothetical protein
MSILNVTWLFLASQRPLVTGNEIPCDFIPAKLLSDNLAASRTNSQQFFGASHGCIRKSSRDPINAYRRPPSALFPL